MNGRIQNTIGTIYLLINKNRMNYLTTLFCSAILLFSCDPCRDVASKEEILIGTTNISADLISTDPYIDFNISKKPTGYRMLSDYIDLKSDSLVVYINTQPNKTILKFEIMDEMLFWLELVDTLNVDCSFLEDDVYINYQESGSISGCARYRFAHCD